MAAPSLAVQIQGQASVSADNLNTYEQTCDNIPELRAFIGTQGIQVVVRGGVTPGDGGGGIYWWNPSGTGPDNGVTVVVPPGAALGAWNLLPIQTIMAFPQVNVLQAGTVLGTTYFVYPANSDSGPTIQTGMNTASSESIDLYIGPGTFTLSENVAYPGSDGRVVIGTGMLWSPGNTGTLDLGNLHVNNGVVASLDILHKTFDNTWTQDVIYTFDRDVDSYNTTGTQVVAISGDARSFASGAHVFGSNFGASINTVGGIATVCEMDCRNNTLTDTGSTQALVLVGEGTAGNGQALQIQAGLAAQFANGILFNAGTNSPISPTGTMFAASGVTAARGFDLRGCAFSLAELSMPSFNVLATPAAPANPVNVSAFTSGNPQIASPGANLGLGSGQIALVTTAVSGFPCMPTCAGAPTGVPLYLTPGQAPFIYDSTDSKIYVYDPIGAAWKGVTVS